MLHHRLLRHSVLLSYEPVLISERLDDALKSALIVDSLFLAGAREGVDARFKVLNLGFEDFVLSR